MAPSSSIQNIILSSTALRRIRRATAGRTYLGAYDVQWNLQGDTTWHIRDPRGQAGCYTALLTVQDLFGTNGTSYEFAANYGQCRFDVFLPAVLK